MIRPWDKRPALVDNAHVGLTAKVAIRQHVLDAIGPARAVVFDAYAGSGTMWQEVWRHAADYTGCDEKWFFDARRCFVADNRRVLRCLDLAPFTIFDLDAYGSPWEAALIVAARRPLAPGEQLGLVITDGTWTHTRMEHWAPGLSEASGLVPNDVMRLAHARYGVHDSIVQRALHGVVERMGGTVRREWRAVGQTGAHMRYLGALVEARTGPSMSPSTG